ncbi:MAG: type II toxin-antitoxin system HicA family toxin [Bacteroidia bacterium]|nr:type II toxin-antitoxin system HicA family toxin [Bacteroidia bacterium]
MPSITPKDLIKILRFHGFILDRCHGSHQVWLHPVSGKRVVVPMHKKDIPISTLYAILKQAGIDKTEI